jgi:hypothetical protein
MKNPQYKHIGSTTVEDHRLNRKEETYIVDIALDFRGGLYRASAHCAVNLGGGSRKHTLSIGGPRKKNLAILGTGDRFSAKRFAEYEARLQDPKTSDNQLLREAIATELWNTHKVYHSQVSFSDSCIPAVPASAFLWDLKVGELIVPEDHDNWNKPKSLDKKSDYELANLYRYLECGSIEVVELDGDRLLIIDEEGKCSERPVNREATALCSREFRKNDVIVGPAILCPKHFLE